MSPARRSASYPRFAPRTGAPLRLLLLAALLQWAAAAVYSAPAMELEVFTLQHRTAEAVVPLLRPFLEPGATLTGQGAKLIVRTTPENLAQIREMLAELDSAPQRLLISVLRGDRQALQQHGLGVQGRLDAEGRARVDVRVHQTESREAAPAVQQVQTLEGEWAMIQAGTSVPIVERQVDAWGRERETIVYKDVTTGFEVLPRISGEQVTVAIRPHKAALTGAGGRIDVQTLETTVAGRLGEWIELGAAFEQRLQRESGTVYSTQRTAERQSRLYLRVERLAP